MRRATVVSPRAGRAASSAASTARPTESSTAIPNERTGVTQHGGVHRLELGHFARDPDHAERLASASAPERHGELEPVTGHEQRRSPAPPLELAADLRVGREHAHVVRGAARIGEQLPPAIDQRDARVRESRSAGRDLRPRAGVGRDGRGLLDDLLGEERPQDPVFTSLGRNLGLEPPSDHRISERTQTSRNRQRDQ